MLITDLHTYTVINACMHVHAVHMIAETAVAVLQVQLPSICQYAAAATETCSGRCMQLLHVCILLQYAAALQQQRAEMQTQSS